MTVHFVNESVTATINATKGEFIIEAPGRVIRGKLTPELAKLAKRLDGEKSGGQMIIRSESTEIEQEGFKQFLQAAAKHAEQSPEAEDIRICAIGVEGILK